MRKYRETWLAVTVALAACCGAHAQSSSTSAQSFPNQPVRIIVPFSAGSITDGLARVLAEKLGEIWRQTVIVENRPGLAGTAAAANAQPDGYTLMLTSSGHAIAGVLNKTLPFDPVTSFSGVTQVASVPLVMVVPPDLSAKTLGEFIALAKEKPGALNFSSAGLASMSYLSGEVFKQAAGIDIAHIPHKGAPEALTSVIRGDAQLFLTGVNAAVDLYQAGKVKVIAIVSSKRNAALPEVPTVAEAGLGDFVYDPWFGVMAPAKTLPSIVDKVSQDIARVLQMPEINERLSKQGVVSVFNTPKKFDELIKRDAERYSTILRAAGVGAN